MTTPPQQVQALAVQAMAASVFASAIGMMIAASGIVPIEPGVAIPGEATPKVLADLRVAFGAPIVDLAVKHVGTGSMTTLAAEIEELYVADMKKRYGEWQTNSALEAAPPGDLRTAREIAAQLAGQRLTAFSPPVQVEGAVRTGTLKGRQKAKPVIDTKTGIRYRSESAAGMAVAADYKLSATRPDGKPNTFVWFSIPKEEREKRFKHVV